MLRYIYTYLHIILLSGEVIESETQWVSVINNNINLSSRYVYGFARLAIAFIVELERQTKF